MTIVQIKELGFKTCFFLENVLRSHGRTCKIFNVGSSKNFVQNLARTNSWERRNQELKKILIKKSHS